MRKILLDITEGYDVLSKATSIAGVAMAVYRRCFLQPNTISVVPEKGYERHDKASDIAIKLMEWRAKQWNTKIHHAGNGREHQITIDGAKYKVDGYIAEEQRAIEFLGCHYHSHPPCCNPDTISPNGKLHRENYALTMERIEKLRQLGGVSVDIGMFFKVFINLKIFDSIEWECDVMRELQKDPLMRKFFDDTEPKGSIGLYSLFIHRNNSWCRSQGCILWWTNVCP